MKRLSQAEIDALPIDKIVIWMSRFTMTQAYAIVSGRLKTPRKLRTFVKIAHTGKMLEARPDEIWIDDSQSTK